MKLAPFLFLGLAACGTDTFVSPDGGDANAPDVQAPDGSETCPAGQTLCGSACVDTTTSVAHCGDCNTACAVIDAGAAACTGGTCVYPMGDSACIALNGNDVFWTNGRGPESGGVYRIGHGMDGGAPTLIANQQAYPHAISADDKQVYWDDIGAGPTDGTVHRASTDGTNVTLVADSSSGVMTPGPLIVAGDKVWWANASDDSLWAAATNGGKSAGPLAFTTGTPLFFTATSDAIYWTANPVSSATSPTIGHYTFDGTVFGDVFTGSPAETFGGLWVDSADSLVCLARTSSGAVDCGLFGVQGPDLPLAQSMSPYGLTATADESFVYWTEHVQSGRVLRASGGNASTPTQLAEDDAPSCVAIDGQFVYWTARGRLLPGVALR